VYARAPSTASMPPFTVAAPPPAHAVCDQPAANAVPENESPTAGLRVISPSPVFATTAQVPMVPRLNCAAVVSMRMIGMLIVTVATFESSKPSLAL
jgi:hypothetical protein